MISDQNVLIVEDEEEWCGIYQRAMGGQVSGLTIKVAQDLNGAAQLIDETKFGVAFVDVGLDISDDRNVDGLRVMEKIRDTGDQTSIIVVTGRSGQDVLPITRDAIKKYDAYDTIGKSTVKPSDIKLLFEGGRAAYKHAAQPGRLDARDVLRGQTDAMIWDQHAMTATTFSGHAGKFYDFLNELFADYLPMLPARDGGQAQIDASSGLIYGAYWSRSIGAAIVVCFGAEAAIDWAITAGADGKLLGRYLTGSPLKVRAAPE